MQPDPVRHSSSLRDLINEAVGLSSEEHSGRYLVPALLIDSGPGDGESTLSAFATMSLSDAHESSRKAFNVESMVEDLRAAAQTARVLFVSKENAHYASIVTLGRAPKSDVAINHASVSKFHCYFTHNARDDRWYLSDADSANGTYLNGRRLEANVKLPLEDGASLRFGLHVKACFFKPAAFYEYLREYGRSLNIRG